MSAEYKRVRPISGQRLPISLSTPRPQAFPDAGRPAAAFLAHLLSGRSNIAVSPGETASCAYRQTEQSDIRRAPPGIRKNLSA
ncbi:hypothetical protein [Pelagibacterium limicola]|uniref:hypothetical protein n=1 Tax=Pelagibacterium limicola TaxID=2791022 RepID=UPI001A9AC3D3|nr:hypothetical protein [Pelagibacterium limicola]